MKRVLLLILILSLTTVKAQVRMSINITAPFDTTHTTKFKLKDLESSTDARTVLNLTYGGYEITNPDAAKKLKGAVIKKVTLVYTQFPEDAKYDELNKKRLAYLFILAPEAFNTPMTKWELVMQMGAKNETQAAGMYHGFIIDYIPAPTMESARVECSSFKDLVSGKEKVTDSTVLKVFERNKKWNNICVVTDFTGSMWPYVGQVAVWHALNLKKKTNRTVGFVFFNDGDMKTDGDKKAMSTGGIYKTKSGNIDSVIATASKTISRGCGGDAPENNVEALVYAIREFPDAEEYVLIADNWANMRDYTFIKNIKKPVHVILCGTNGGINIQYLELAYQTKGTIHTIEKDIYDLAKLTEGQVIELGGVKFKFVKGKFQLIPAGTRT